MVKKIVFKNNYENGLQLFGPHKRLSHSLSMIIGDKNASISEKEKKIDYKRIEIELCR